VFDCHLRRRKLHWSLTGFRVSQHGSRDIPHVLLSAIPTDGSLRIRALGLKLPILLLQRNFLSTQALNLLGLLYEFKGEKPHEQNENDICRPDPEASSPLRRLPFRLLCHTRHHSLPRQELKGAIDGCLRCVNPNYVIRSAIGPETSPGVQADYRLSDLASERNLRKSAPLAGYGNHSAGTSNDQTVPQLAHAGREGYIDPLIGRTRISFCQYADDYTSGRASAP
jgi:hypothetical protein